MIAVSAQTMDPHQPINVIVGIPQLIDSGQRATVKFRFKTNKISLLSHEKESLKESRENIQIRNSPPPHNDREQGIKKIPKVQVTKAPLPHDDSEKAIEMISNVQTATVPLSWDRAERTIEKRSKVQAKTEPLPYNRTVRATETISKAPTNMEALPYNRTEQDMEKIQIITKLLQYDGTNDAKTRSALQLVRSPLKSIARAISRGASRRDAAH